MTSKSMIRTALNFGDMLMMSGLGDMKEAALTRPGKFGGNHAVWTAGHLTVIEGRLQKILHGTPNPVEHWKPRCDWGSEPGDEASKYPPFDEVLGAYRSLRAKTLAYLDSLDESGLDRPPAMPPPGLGGFETVGNALLTIAMHQCFHAGEAAVARRASGKEPRFTPSAEQRAF